MEATPPEFKEKDSRPWLERFTEQQRGVIAVDIKDKQYEIGWDLTTEEAEQILEQIVIRFPELQRRWRRAGAHSTFTWLKFT